MDEYTVHRTPHGIYVTAMHGMPVGDIDALARAWSKDGYKVIGRPK